MSSLLTIVHRFRVITENFKVDNPSHRKSKIRNNNKKKHYLHFILFAVNLLNTILFMSTVNSGFAKIHCHCHFQCCCCHFFLHFSIFHFVSNIPKPCSCVILRCAQLVSYRSLLLLLHDCNMQSESQSLAVIFITNGNVYDWKWDK